jgi:pimeloyl-ACP methyl ester carboxylesterase
MKIPPSLAAWGKTLPLKNGDIFYYDSGTPPGGTQKPAVLLLHGLGDEADSWRHLMPLLYAAGNRVIAPDLPGFGRSRAKGANIRGQAAAALALLEKAAAGKPAVLAGNSMGAIIAEAAAFRRPDLAGALILIDGCFPMTGGPGTGTTLLSAIFPFAGRRWYRSFRADHEGAWRSLYPFYGDLDAMSAEDREFLRERVVERVESRSQERGYFAALRSFAMAGIFSGGRFSRRLAAFPGKILLVWGEKDAVIPRETAQAVLALRNGTEIKIIQGAGHLPQQERPRETAEAILSFLADLPL